MLDTRTHQQQEHSPTVLPTTARQQPQERVLPSSGSTDHLPAIARVTRHLNAQLSKRHTLEELAALAGCSIWHFDRIFHKVTHLSPMAYLSAARMEAAKRLLVISDALIIDICYEVGYTSLGSFGKRFTKMIGLSPRRVRTLARNFDADAFRAMFREAIPAPPPENPVKVTITSAEDDNDDNYLVFAGLFNSEVPTLQPVACAIHQGMGPLNIAAPPAGRYRGFAVAIPADGDAEDMILQDLTLRGAGEEIVVANDQPLPQMEIAVRTPNSLSAPLLPIMPLMLQQRLNRMQ